MSKTFKDRAGYAGRKKNKKRKHGLGKELRDFRRRQKNFNDQLSELDSWNPSNQDGD